MFFFIKLLLNIDVNVFRIIKSVCVCVCVCVCNAFKH